MAKTILLHSGGIDSTALASLMRPELCFSVNYGQVCANAECGAAKALCDKLSLAHDMFEADFSSLAKGALAGSDQIVEAPTPEWWPFRNQLLATIAAMKAVDVQASRIVLGSVSTDSVHADGTQRFYRTLSELVSQQELNIVVEAPGLHMTSSELVRKSGISLELLPLTYSCHVGNMPCSQCRGCRKRYEVFRELGLECAF